MRGLAKYKPPGKWAFIVGCYNSGTTLLRQLIDLHPVISSVRAEGIFYTPELSFPEQLGWLRMWHKCMDEMLMDENTKGVDPDGVKRDWSFFLDSSKGVYLEKSIPTAARMRWFQHHFENAHFIHLIRNGYAVAEGIQRKTASHKVWKVPKQFNGKYPIEMCAKQWVVNNQIVEDQKNDIRHLHQLTYEELMNNPKEEIEKIWTFLGLEIPAQWYDESRAFTVHFVDSTLQDMNHRSFDRLSKEQMIKIESEASELLQHYSYPLLSENLT